MDDVGMVLPRLPYEVLNVVLGFMEEGLIRHQYHIGSGRVLHAVHWTAGPRYDLESTVLVRRFFPANWYYNRHPDDKFIYFYMKDYFRQLIQEEGAWRME